jgi:hypothetical protein
VAYDPHFDPFAEEREEFKKACERDKGRMKLGPKSGLIIGLPDARKENPSSDAPPHSFPPVHLSESNDSKVHDGLGPEGSKEPHSSESKNTVADSAGLNSEHLPRK